MILFFEQEEVPSIDSEGNMLLDEDYNLLKNNLGLGGVLKNALV